MNREQTPQKVSRRVFLRLGLIGGGVLVLKATGALANADRLQKLLPMADIVPIPTVQPEREGAKEATLLITSTTIRLAATDGFISLPGREPLYVFGFNQADPNASINDVIGTHKGQVQAPAPIINLGQGDSVYLTLTNTGLVIRPDLDDSHTVHWHGFRNPVALFDGVPEVSIAVPVARDFTYFFRPQDPGTYMYHCHFEDTEHVQMGMTGIVFVRPTQNDGTITLPAGKYVYNDEDGSTAYDREFTLLLNEVDTRPHDLLAAVQEFVWSDYKPNYWLINGRAYPDTLLPTNDPALPFQPISSLIQANAGDQVLLRMANLGYEQHAMQLTGISLKVVGHDATYLGALASQPAKPDISYMTNTIYIGPGEARDVIFTAPTFDALAPATFTDPNLGSYNAYQFKNRSYQKLTNGGLPGPGGMITEVRIYQDPLPAQTASNETFS